MAFLQRNAGGKKKKKKGKKIILSSGCLVPFIAIIVVLFGLSSALVGVWNGIVDWLEGVRDDFVFNFVMNDTSRYGVSRIQNGTSDIEDLSVRDLCIMLSSQGSEEFYAEYFKNSVISKDDMALLFSEIVENQCMYQCYNVKCGERYEATLSTQEFKSVLEYQIAYITAELTENSGNVLVENVYRNTLSAFQKLQDALSDTSLSEEEALLMMTEQEIQVMVSYMARQALFTVNPEGVDSGTVSVFNEELVYFNEKWHIKCDLWSKGLDTLYLNYGPLYQSYSLPWQAVIALEIMLNIDSLDDYTNTVGEGVSTGETAYIEIDEGLVNRIFQAAGYFEIKDSVYGNVYNIDYYLTKELEYDYEWRNEKENYVSYTVLQNLPRMEYSEEVVWEESVKAGRLSWIVPQNQLNSFQGSVADVTSIKEGDKVVGLEITPHIEEFFEKIAALFDSESEKSFDQQFFEALVGSLPGGMEVLSNWEKYKGSEGRTMERSFTSPILPGSTQFNEFARTEGIGGTIIYGQNVSEGEEIQNPDIVSPDGSIVATPGNVYVPPGGCTGSAALHSSRVLSDQEKEAILSSMGEVSDLRRQIVSLALDSVGKIKYSQGRRNPRADWPEYLDCSSFCSWLYWKCGAGVESYLPASATTMSIFNAVNALRVPADQLKPGDLVFNKDCSYMAGHVGIYIGKAENGLPMIVHCDGDLRVGDGNVFYGMMKIDYLTYGFQLLD